MSASPCPVFTGAGAVNHSAGNYQISPEVVNALRGADIYLGGSMSDAGHETVGQALLIAGIGIGVLSAAQLGQVVVHSLNGLMVAWG